MTMEEGTLVAWHVQPGETFVEGDILYEVETEKVTSEFNATGNGVMIEHCVSDGDEVPVGAIVCRVETAD